jgi:hypothetical protein
MAPGLTPPKVLADLIAEGVRRRKGAVGVLVRDVPAPDPNRLLRALATLHDEGIELRIAYLREGGQAAPRTRASTVMTSRRRSSKPSAGVMTAVSRR